MDIKPNSSESYRGKDIREWCEANPDNYFAQGIARAYFHRTKGNQPLDGVYYYVESFPLFNLIRDYEKSPKHI